MNCNAASSTLHGSALTSQCFSVIESRHWNISRIKVLGDKRFPRDFFLTIEQEVETWLKYSSARDFMIMKDRERENARSRKRFVYTPLWKIEHGIANVRVAGFQGYRCSSRLYAPRVESFGRFVPRVTARERDTKTQWPWDPRALCV